MLVVVVSPNSNFPHLFHLEKFSIQPTCLLGPPAYSKPKSTLRHTGTIMGQGGQQEQKSTDLHGDLFRTTPCIGNSLGPKAPPGNDFIPSFSMVYISHNYTNSSLSSNKILLVFLYSLFDLLCIISVSKKNSNAFQKGHFCSPWSPN